MSISNRRVIIGVMGGADPHLPEEVVQAAEEVGRGIAEAGAVLLCGGRTGIMLAASRGAKSVPGGETLAVLPGGDPDRANPYIDMAVATDMGNARNVTNVLSSDAVIAFPGGAGTLSEMALALKCGIHLIGYRTWDLLSARQGVPDPALKAYYHPATSAREALELALRFARRPLPGTQETFDEIRALIEKRLRAWNNGDGDTLLEGYLPSENITVAIQGRCLRGHSELSSELKGSDLFPSGKMNADGGNMAWTGLPGRAVYAVCPFMMDGETPEGGVYSAVLLRGGEGYLILAEHLSRRDR